MTIWTNSLVPPHPKATLAAWPYRVDSPLRYGWFIPIQEQSK